MAGDLKTSQLVELLKADVTDSDLFAIVHAGESRKIKKSTIFSLISDLITAGITAFQQTFGMLVMGVSTPLANIIGLADSKIKVVDVTVFSKNNHVTHSYVEDNSTINTNGVFDLSIFGSMTAPQNSIITLTRYKNNQPIVGASFSFTGAGTKAVQINGAFITELLAGDVIDIRAKADDADTTITIVAAQLRIERTHH